MLVRLASIGNPDFGQDPNKPMYGCEKGKLVKVATFKEASEKCRKFIDDNDLGGGNWFGGEIYNDDDKNTVIAHVSYNGRVWEGSEWTPQTREIQI